ncbi:hypothetical protein WR25_06918 [Diploscapter pachys]|uniref:Peptidase S72 domain-containing protein n=1 Tax=Diploscapter pachys TaxID=2018661 RepID=A0A2A2KZD8_9BILA|nr:hypothetical protein WR25_06918 [Diploscapter pachys]
MLLFALLPLSVWAAPKLTQESVFVGQVYQKELDSEATVSGQSGAALPNWLIFRNNILQGIPTENNIGTHLVEVKSASGSDFHTLKFVVKEDHENPCGTEDTFWLEAIYSNDEGTQMRLDAAIEIGQFQPLETLRVYSANYSRKFRNVELVMADAEDPKFAVIWKVACNDVDAATDAMDAFITEDEVDYEQIVLTKGRVIPGTNKIESTTVVSTTTKRTTRGLYGNDARPVRLNPMPTYKCTNSLDSNAKQYFALGDRNITGIPMKSGEFNFRLEARDKNDQMVTAPFTINVYISPKTNHLVDLEMDKPIKEFESDPLESARFIKRLSDALGAPPSTFTIREIKQGVNPNKSVVTWSNNSLTAERCNEDAIMELKNRMVTKQKERTKTEFIKAIGPQFYVRKASTRLTGNCLKESEMETTQIVPVASEPSSAGIGNTNWMLVLIILGSLLLLICLILIVCSIRGKGKKKIPSEYMTKGSPVVFPDEVDEDNGDHAGTPMLTREERPPLKVSTTENPLYKPPPPLTAASPRIPAGSAHISAAQKMPPPYVPP